jgi:hypothetical protein
MIISLRALALSFLLASCAAMNGSLFRATTSPSSAAAAGKPSRAAASGAA